MMADKSAAVDESILSEVCTTKGDATALRNYLERAYASPTALDSSYLSEAQSTALARYMSMKLDERITQNLTRQDSAGNEVGPVRAATPYRHPQALCPDS